MKTRLLFAWYDIWVGVFWDRKGRKLYFLPLPCLGIVLEFPKYRDRSEKVMCKMITLASDLKSEDLRQFIDYAKGLKENLEFREQQAAAAIQKLPLG